MYTQLQQPLALYRTSSEYYLLHKEYWMGWILLLVCCQETN